MCPPEGEPISDWRQSYLTTGCLLVRGCRKVEGLRRFDIARLGLHPDAPNERRSRMEWAWEVKPYPGGTLSLGVDVGAELFPRTMELVLAGQRRPGV